MPSRVWTGQYSGMLVKSEGDIVELGTQEVLLAARGFYAELYNSQFEYAEVH